jgi:hypothetical protein
MEFMTNSPRIRSVAGTRYPVLRTIAILYLIGACVTAVVGCIGIIYALGWGAPRAASMVPGTNPSSWGDRLSMAGYIFGGTFLAVISMLAIAEVLKLFIDIERSCRSMAMNMPVSTATTTTVVEGNQVVSTTARHSRVAQLLDGDETAEGALLRGH